MNTTKIIKKENDFNESLIEFFPQNENPLNKGIKFINFKYDHDLLYIQTPVLTLPSKFQTFGMNTTNNAYSILVSLKNTDSSFLELLHKIDCYFLNWIKNNASTWMGRTYNIPEMYDQMYTPLVKQNANFPPSLSIRLKFRNNEPMFTVFNEDKTPVSITHDVLPSLFTKGSQFKMIVKCHSIWYTRDSKFGITLEAFQFKKVQSEVHTLNNNVCLIDDDDEDENYDY